MPELPPIDYGAHLLPILFEIGPSISVGMGSAPVTCEHIDPWCRRMGIDLQPWECTWLMRLSKEWADEGSTATKHFTPPPWNPETD